MLSSNVVTTAAAAAFTFISWQSAATATETIKLRVLAAQSNRMLSVSMLGEFMLPEVNKRLAERGNNYQIEWQESYAGVVATSNEMLSAIEAGIGDIGYVGTLFEPAKLPLSQISYYVPFTGTTLENVLGAATDLEKTFPEIDAAFEANGQHVLTLMGTARYVLTTNFPVDSIDDLNGRKLGLAGASVNWIKGSGAVPVNAVVSDYYNSIKTGIYDGVFAFASGLIPFKLYEVAPYVTDVGLGSMQSTALTINMRKWQSLPEEVREVLTEVGTEFGTLLAKAEDEAAEDALAKAAELGATVTVMSDEERQKWANSMPNIAADWAATYEAQNLPARAMVSAYLDALRSRGANLARDWAAEWK
ncbi:MULTISPECIES: C4-dicarboxylate TRAP transporter substrate-binding protein [Chelativorans]|jgi:TRAP-type C4-dicarboxylate transport system substrate-binding protein|uniref:TRAP dicarboxylate transporter-DctP subunit n=1 Tax=Chelativorans sp. (strain BNC1) TaxID=266779 RepID=Q11E68_CHESB|nr:MULTISPECIES: C4-dicarboxylate TRAP transporter substrate-binding protein [Chelativorans]